MATTPQHLQPQSTWRTLRIGRISVRIDRRVLPVLLMLFVVATGTLIFSISYGEYDISMIDVLRTILGVNESTDRENHELVVWTFRMPRILVAGMVGMALAVSGAIMQGITRNPLADPGILGVTTGASLAAVAVIVWYDVSLSLLPYATFSGAAIMAILIYVLAWKGGSSSIRLILIGIGLSAIASSLTTTMIVFGEIRDVQQAYIWLAGSVYGRGWQHVQVIALWLVVLIPLAIFSARHLNTLNLGDEVAKGLGLNVELQRAWLLFLSVALAAIAVAVAGTVGFIGLVAPHITRRLVGPAHEGLIIATALLGAALALLAELIGRAVIAPSELPLGVVTAMIGAPYFMFLLYRTRR
jgi:iron complex transport system permease protein